LQRTLHLNSGNTARSSNYNNLQYQSTSGGGGGGGAVMERHGSPLLDQESLASILVLLFIEDPNLSTLRLYRVIRHLCFHVPTRKWVIRALLSIIDRCNEQIEASSGAGTPISKKNEGIVTGTISKNVPRDFLSPGSTSPTSSKMQRPHWLNIRLDAALGCRANVFVVKKQLSTIIWNSSAGSSSKHRQKKEIPISLHPKAAPVVCRHTLDLLIFLSKSFRVHFLPIPTPKAAKTDQDASKATVDDDEQPTTSQQTIAADNSSNEFWDILMFLDGDIKNRLMTASATTTTEAANRTIEFSEPDIKTFLKSPFAHLIHMLSYKIIKKSCQLTDKLLRLLSLISTAFSEEAQKQQKNTLAAAAAAAAVASLTAATESATTTPTGGEPKDQPQTAVAEYDSRLPESEEHLQLAIEVLTSKSCSEDGLEDATTLLVNLSQCSDRTRQMILELLIHGAISLSFMVQQHINDLMVELRELNKTHKPLNKQQQASQSGGGSDETDNDVGGLFGGSLNGGAGGSSGANRGGVLQDRFTKDTVVITAPFKMKTPYDLQLPSMAPLVSKTSSQAFFLRILKVITQIRDSVKHPKPPVSGGKVAAPVEKTVDTMSLSETLNLDTLWNTLSDCLKELEDTPDHHAVLVLQPAVEAFFLVHSSSQPKRSTEVPTTSAAATGGESSTANATAASVAATTSGAGPSRSQQQEETAARQNSSQQRAATAVSESSSGGAGENVAPVSPILFNIPVDAVMEPAETMRQQTPMDTETSRNETMNATEAVIAETSTLQISATTTSSTAAPTTMSTTDMMPASPTTHFTPVNNDQRKFLRFAEKHRVVLNQILRQSTTHLPDGPFAVLVDHTRILDFDVKRRYFRTELERMDEGVRREELAVHVHRVSVFEDSFRELYRRNQEDWKNRFYIVFENEEGQDAGGLLREWYVIISREIFNPMYALFRGSPGDRVTYMINPSSHCNPNHLCYFKFVGRVIGECFAKDLCFQNVQPSFFVRSQPKRSTTTNCWNATSHVRSTNTFWAFRSSTRTWLQRIMPSTKAWSI
jgi:E3 ubiquitin-protein ligase HUWE1